MNDSAKLAQLIIEECQKLEPGKTEVCVDASTETKIVFENIDFSVASSTQSTVFGIRNIVNERQGFVTSNSLNEHDLKEKAREVQMVARLSPPSPHHNIAPAQSVLGNYDLVDPKLQGVKPKELVEWLKGLVDQAKSDSRVTLDRAEISIAQTSRVVANSLGNLQVMNQSLCGWYVMGMAKDGEQVTSFDYDGNYEWRAGLIPSAIEKTAKEFRSSVVGSLDPRPVKSYKGKVLLHPSAVGSLILGVIGFNVNARSQQDGMSQWKEALNTKVASELLTVFENPLNQDRPGSWTPFDREGVMTSRHTVLDEGVLKFTAQNAFTAHRGKTKLTGNAVGGARGVSSIGLYGLTVKPGQQKQESLLSDLGTGLLLKRFSGNSDPVSGQFSGIAKNSYWVENGNISYPIKEVMISGNLFEVIKSVCAVGKDLYNQGGSYDAPYVLVDGISITAG